MFLIGLQIKRPIRRFSLRCLLDFRLGWGLASPEHGNWWTLKLAEDKNLSVWQAQHLQDLKSPDFEDLKALESFLEFSSKPSATFLKTETL